MASAVKELIEDWRRIIQDSEVNNRKAKVLQGQKFVEIPWRLLQVGDLLRVESGDAFPADLILISSSEPDAICYIETSNLDGETNLKIRQGLTETANLLDPMTISHFEATIRSESPNNSLYTYEGTMKFNAQELPLEPIQLLLRGAVLRNTRWIYGVVVFTGHETKLMKNATSTPIKSTKVSRMVNSQIIFLFIILSVMAVVCTLAALYRHVIFLPFDLNQEFQF